MVLVGQLNPLTAIHRYSRGPDFYIIHLSSFSDKFSLVFHVNCMASYLVS